MNILTKCREYDLVVVAIVGEGDDTVNIERSLFASFRNIRLHEEEKTVAILNVDTAEISATSAVEVDLETVIFVAQLARLYLDILSRVVINFDGLSGGQHLREDGVETECVDRIGKTVGRIGCEIIFARVE